MCSTPDAALAEITSAIDELAAASRDDAATPQLAERIARIWAMVADVDPELARRRSGYEAKGAKGLVQESEREPPPGPARR